MSISDDFLPRWHYYSPKHLQNLPSLSAHADQSDKEVLPSSHPGEVHRDSFRLFSAIDLDDLLIDVFESKCETESLDLGARHPSESDSRHRHV